MKRDGVFVFLSGTAVAAVLWSVSTVAAPKPASEAPSRDTRAATAGTTFEGCPVFPNSSPWNRDVSKLAVHPNSANFIRSISESDGKHYLHPDFGENPTYGIPFDVVPADQNPVPITYNAYGDESDKGPFPIPLNAKVEGGSDRHVLVVQRGECRLFELFVARRTRPGLVGGRGRDLEPALEQAAPEVLDLSRRRRPADLPRPGAL